MPPARNEPPSAQLQPPRPPSGQSGLPRRDFLTLAGLAALWATLGASLIALARFLGFVEPESPQVFTLDVPGVYPLGTLTPAADRRAFIGRDRRGLFAIAATCTHLGCLVEMGNQRLECPCHGSRFDAAGAVLQGPAARPLARVSLTLGSEGRVVMNLRQAVDEDYRLAADG